MATYDLTVGGSNSAHFADAGREVIAKKAIDCTSQAIALGETAKLMLIPAGYKVKRVEILVTAVEAAADTFDLGDSASATTYMSNADSSSAVGTVLTGNGAAGTTLNAWVEKYYSAADYIELKADADLSAFKGVLIVTMAKYSV